MSFIPVSFASKIFAAEICVDPALDLKPEDVLIVIDDVEALIKAELALAAPSPAPPTRLVGVPPSKGRGGNPTPRYEPGYITSSRPLSSPSSSATTIRSFAVKKIENEQATSKSAPQSEKGMSGSTDAAVKGMSNISLDASPRNQSSDVQDDSPDPNNLLEKNITVKIADFGNGTAFLRHASYLTI